MEESNVLPVDPYFTAQETRIRLDEQGRTIREILDVKRLYDLPLVKHWPRFGYYVLDSIITRVLILVIIIAAFIALDGAGLNTDPYYFDTPVGKLMDMLLTWTLYALVYFVFEIAMQRTVGKAVAGCVVVNEWGKKPNFGQLLGRSFARLVPFEPFSCLGGKGSRGWHDKWSGTYVIRKKELQLFVAIMNERRRIDTEKKRRPPVKAPAA